MPFTETVNIDLVLQCQYQIFVIHPLYLVDVDPAYAVHSVCILLKQNVQEIFFQLPEDRYHFSLDIGAQ